MLRVLSASVYNLAHAIHGMRNSWGSNARSDSTFSAADNYYRWSVEAPTWQTLTGGPMGRLGAKDLQLALQLRKAGADHAKYSRFVLVGMEIEAGGDWWQQFDQYRVGADAITNSTSRMHTLGREPIGPDQFGFDDPAHPLAAGYVELLREAWRAWVASGKRRPSVEWRLMEQLTAYAWLYRREVVCNYQVLRGIYLSRRHHRLDEWETFCGFLEDMPSADLITLGGGED